MLLARFGELEGGPITTCRPGRDRSSDGRRCSRRQRYLRFSAYEAVAQARGRGKDAQRGAALTHKQPPRRPPSLPTPSLAGPLFAGSASQIRLVELSFVDACAWSCWALPVVGISRWVGYSGKKHKGD